MITYPTHDSVNNARVAFIETLSAEFTAKTGVGVYVYLSPLDINQLFKQYLQNHESIQFFVKQCVRSILV